MRATRPVRFMGALALVLAAAVSFASTTAQAQNITPDDVERMLVPILPPNGLPGRFGAFWVGELWVRNSAEVPVVFGHGVPFRNLPDGGLKQVEAGVTQLSVTGALRGGIYVVEKVHRDQIHLSLRIADVNRRPVNMGTEIPIVREEGWLARPVELLDVPTDFSVRQTLRVYDPDASQQVSVRMTIHPLTENEAIAEAIIEPRDGSVWTTSFPWYHDPDYAEIPDLVAAFPQVAAYPRVRIRLEPTGPGMRYWAFVTITDNMTQHVSVITPQ
jgi:hypothetical protein